MFCLHRHRGNFAIADRACGPRTISKSAIRMAWERPDSGVECGALGTCALGSENQYWELELVRFPVNRSDNRRIGPRWDARRASSLCSNHLRRRRQPRRHRDSLQARSRAAAASTTSHQQHEDGQNHNPAHGFPIDVDAPAGEARHRSPRRRDGHVRTGDCIPMAVSAIPLPGFPLSSSPRVGLPLPSTLHANRRRC